VSVVSRDSRSEDRKRTSGPAKPPRRLSKKHREWIAGYLFVAPDAIGLFVFLGIPMILSLGMGFFDVSGFGGYSFVGFENYQRMFTDEQFLGSVSVTAVYLVGFVAGVFVMSLVLALLVKQKMPLVGLFRSMFFLPHVVSLVVVGLVWQFMLVDGIGVVNRLLRTVGLSSVSWLGNPRYALWTVIAISVWFFMGYYMIIFLSGLQDIPQEYYDAAKIDGANALESFRYITWPLLRPTSFFVLLVTTVTGVAGLQAFDLIYVMTQGGPANSTTLGVFYIYQQAFKFNNVGYASAMATLYAFALLAMTAVAFRITRGGRFDHD
jgi:multiple sugar transport system permease protein